MQARANTNTAIISGSNALYVEGVYVPSAELELSGGPCGNPMKGLIVSDTLEIASATCITKPDELPTGVRYTPVLVLTNSESRG